MFVAVCVLDFFFFWVGFLRASLLGGKERTCLYCALSMYACVCVFGERKSGVVRIQLWNLGRAID
jgi:hypothetical protein